MRNINKFLFCILIFFVIFVWSSLVSADTILSDDFNSYSDGDLVGQGGWLHYPGQSQTVNYTVQTFVVNEGTKAVALTGSSSDSASIYKLGTPRTDGSMTFYFRASSINARVLYLYCLTME